jgi:hypothetical protein
MGTKTQVVDRESGYLFLFLLVCQYSFSTLVCSKLMVTNLPKMSSLLQTLPKYSLGRVGGEFKNIIIIVLVLGYTSSKIGFGA